MRIAKLSSLAAALVASWAVVSLGGGCGSANVASRLLPDTPAQAATLEPQLRATIRRDGPTAERFTRLAGAQLRLNKLRAARSSVQRAIGLDPSYSDAMVVGAQVALASDDTGLALRYYERAVEADPSTRSSVGKQWAKTLIDVAKKRAEAGSPAGVMMAVNTLDSRLPELANDFNDDRAELMAKAAELFLMRGDAERGRQALTLARAAGAPSDETAFLDASLKLATDDTAGARAGFEAWVTRAPSPERWRRVGEMGRSQRDYGLALEAFERANPSTEDELRALAETALKAKKPEKAVQAWRRLAGFKKASPKAAATVLMEGARELEDRAYLAKAYELYSEAVELTPQRWSTIKAVGEFLSERYARLGEVPKLVRRHLVASNWSTESVSAGVKLLVSAQQVIAASKLVAQAQGKPGASPELQLLRARLAHLQQNGTEREQAMRAYVVSDPRSLDVLTKAGRAWLDFKVLSQATLIAKQAYAKAPSDPRAALLLADTHRAARASGPEKAVLQAYLAAAPDKDRAALEVGRRFYERQDFRTAIRHLTTATRSSKDDLRLAAHKLLFELYFRGKESSRGMAAPHLRSWLALLDSPAEREELLDGIIATTTNNRSVVAVRQVAITELLQLRPKDPALHRELGQAQLLARRYSEARASFDMALNYSKQRAVDAQRYGSAFSKVGQSRHALHFFEKITPEELEGNPDEHLKMGRWFDDAARRERATKHYKLYLQWALKRRVTDSLKAFGDRMLKARRPVLAAKAFEAALEKSPKNRASQRGLGQALLRLGEVAPARLILDRYVASAGRRSYQAMEEVAGIFKVSGALEDAARVMEEMFVKNRRRRSQLFRDIVGVYRRMGALENVRRIGRRFLEINNHDANTILIVSKALGNAGLWDEAYGMLTDALDPPRLGAATVGGRAKPRRRPRGKTKRMLLQAAGEMALQRKQLPAALEHFRGFALASRSRPHDWGNMAARIARAGYPAEAAKFLTYPLDKDLMDGDPKFFMQRGTYRMEAGNTEAAHNDFLEAISRTLSVSEMLPQIEAVYRKYGQLRRLRRVLARAIQMAPTRSQLFLSLGKLLLEGGRDAEAGQAFKRYLASKERGHIDVAKAYAAAGFPKRALAHYELSYEHSPNPQSALREAARLLTQLGMTERLEHHVQRFLLVSKRPTDAFRDVGQVWADIVGDSKRALSWYRRAAEAAPSRSSNDHMIIGKLAWKAGDKATAEREFRLHLNGSLKSPAMLVSASRDIMTLYVHRGDFAGATALLNHADALLGSHHLLALRTELLVLQGKVDEALELVRSNTAGMSQAGSFMANAVRELAAQGRLEEALWLADAAIAAGQRGFFVELQLKLRAKLGLVEDAAESGQSLVTEDTPGRHLQAARALLAEGIIGPAVKHLESVLSTGLESYDPMNSSHAGKVDVVVNALVLMTRAQRHRGRTMTPSQLTALIRERVKTGDDLLTRDRLVAKTFFALGRYDLARDAAIAGLNRVASDPALVTLLVDASVLLSDPAGLLAVIAETPSMRESELAHRSALRASAMNHPRFALAMIADVLKRKGGNLVYLRQALGWALQVGDDQDVEAYAVRFAQAQERSKRAYVELAAMAAEHGYTAHAKRWAKQAEGATGIDGHALRLLALGTAIREGDSTSIQAAADAVIKSAPDERIARLQVGDLLAEQNGPGRVALAALAPLSKSEDAQGGLLLSAVVAAWRGGDIQRAHELFVRMTNGKRSLGRSSGAVTYRLLRAAIRAQDLVGLKKVMEAFESQIGGRSRRGDLISGKHRMLQLVRLAAVDEHGLSVTTRRALADVLADGLRLTGGRGWAAEDRSIMESSIHELRGDMDRAHAVLDAHLERDPSNATVANNLAYSMADEKVDLARALKLVDQALLLRIDGAPVVEESSTFLDTKAWVLFRMGRFKEALALQERAVYRSGAPQSGVTSGSLKMIREWLPLFRVTTGWELEMRYHLGMIERANGLVQRSLQTFRDCARRAPGEHYAELCKAELNAPIR